MHYYLRQLHGAFENAPRNSLTSFIKNESLRDATLLRMRSTSCRSIIDNIAYLPASEAPYATIWRIAAGCSSTRLSVITVNFIPSGFSENRIFLTDSWCG